MGVSICRVANGGYVTVPSMPITIYESAKCPKTICHDFGKKIEQINKNLGKPFKIDHVKIDKLKTPPEIYQVPAAQMGDHFLFSDDFDEDTLVQIANQNYTSTKQPIDL